MKKILLTIVSVLLLSAIYAQNEPGYTPYNSKVQFNMIYLLKGTTIPAGATPSLALGQSPKAGAIYVDSVNNRFYFYSGGSWHYSPTSVLSRFGLSGEDVSAGEHRTFNLHHLYNMTFDSVKEFSVKKDGLYRFHVTNTVSAMYSPFGSNLISVDENGPGMVNGNGIDLNIIQVKEDSSYANKKISYTNNLHSTFTEHSLVDVSWVDSLIASSGVGGVDTVHTDAGTGVLGGDIVGVGTISIDTTIIATKAHVRDKLDSVISIFDDYVPDARAITINGVTQNLSTNRTWTITSTADTSDLALYFLRRKDSLTTTNVLGYVTKKILADSTDAVRSAITNYTFPYSVTAPGNAIQLTNDASSPGNNKFYGTNKSGTKGFLDFDSLARNQWLFTRDRYKWYSVPFDEHFLADSSFMIFNPRFYYNFLVQSRVNS
jgi:hypothetical protein